MKRIFVSFHHDENQCYADEIRSLIEELEYEDITPNEGTKVEDEDTKTSEQIRKRNMVLFL